MSSRFPEWMHKPLPRGSKMLHVEDTLTHLGLNTVCLSARCPNRGECYASGTATFLILGDICTRGCRFCAVKKGRPQALDPAEPENVARAAQELKLRHVVVTSVTRDDLPDGGADHFARTVRSLHQLSPACKVEVLTPDFAGKPEAVEAVLQSHPDIYNHNVETVQRLYQLVRPGANYRRSLDLLEHVKTIAPDTYTKSGIMMGLGETLPEITQVLQDLVEVGCDIVTIGQYLQPSAGHLPVDRYLPPDEFSLIKDLARSVGVRYVYAGPYVRSSYRAHEVWSHQEETK